MTTYYTSLICSAVLKNWSPVGIISVDIKPLNTLCHENFTSHLIHIIVSSDWNTPFPEDFDSSQYGELVKFYNLPGDTTLIDILLEDFYMKTNNLSYFMFIQKILNLYSFDREHKIMEYLINHLKRQIGKPIIDIERTMGINNSLPS